MLEYVTLEDATGTRVSLHDGAGLARLAKADGLVGLTPVREVVRARSGGHGSVNRSRWLSDRLIVLEGEVWGGSQAAAFTELDRIQAAFADAVDTPRLLRYRRGWGAGVDLQTEVQAVDLKATLAGGGRFLKYQAQLRASDPRAYGQAEQVVASAPFGDTGGGFTFAATFPATFEPGSSGQAHYTNAGTTDTPPVFRLYGELENPRVQLDSTGETLALTATVGPDDFVELDVAERTVKLNGVTPRLDWRDFTTSDWFELPRASGTVRLLADDGSADAYMTVTFRPAYV